MAGQSGIPLGVEVDLTSERMTVTSSRTVIADWPLPDIRVRSMPDGFHIEAEGEEIILNVFDAKRFAAALGLRLG